MQLLYCYDLVGGKASPFADLFYKEDWLGFEYMRDVKYHYSEGYGAAHPGKYATPWLDAATRLVGKSPNSEPLEGRLPLWIAFTHREEILYLAVLLGLAYDGPDAPRTDQLDQNRNWRVALLAPYLGHIGLEKFRALDGEHKMRVVVNGEVVPAFRGQLQQDSDGGYGIAEVREWVQSRIEEWDAYKGGRITFLDHVTVVL